MSVSGPPLGGLLFWAIKVAAGAPFTPVMGLPVTSTRLARALFVDDDPQVRSSLMRLARGLGVPAEAAATGEEALALASYEQYGLVIADIHMPGMGGIALLERVSALQPTARVVVLTGDRLHPVHLPRLERVIYKPWREDEMLAVLSGLPLPATDVAPETPVAAAQRPLHVLLVDDSRLDMELLRVALRKGGEKATIEWVASLAEGVLVARVRRFDVIVSDLGLPDAQGLDAVFALLGAASDTPLVVLSATFDDGLAQRAVQAGAQDYLVKGAVGAAEVVRTLRYAIERKAGEKRTLSLALYDQLTGLPNRALFRQRLAQVLARGRRNGARFAVALLDVDRFKQVNDSLGHDAGDAFLQHIGRRLESLIAAGDTVARLGGDEFALLFESDEGDQALTQKLTRIVAELAVPYVLEGTEIASSVSVGVAVYPTGGDGTEALFKAADTALYEAKKLGRNGFRVFGDELSRRMRRELELAQDLRGALERQEYHLVFQAQVDMRTGEPFGIEALLRWKRRQSEPVSPVEFVPLLEESGGISEVGAWVLEEACAATVRLSQSLGRQLRACVNVSAQQLRARDYATRVLEVLERTGLPPERLELEVTESTLLENSQLTQEHIGLLRRQGIRLALDDFGTGWASLSYLAEFPADTLKLDRTFVRDIESDARRSEIIRAVVGLGQGLRMEVLAEGVETEAQGAYLISLGCDRAQGYWYHRPAADLSGLRKALPLAV